MAAFFDDPNAVAGRGRHQKLVITDGRIVGAILVGHSRELPTVQRAIDDRRDVSMVLDELRAGEWEVLTPA